MTKSRYYIMSIMKLFATRPHRKFLENATHEMHLMKTAQHLLGYYNYEYVEELDEVKTEYWIVSIIEKRQDISTQAQEVEELIGQRIAELVEAREDLISERTVIFNRGKTIRKKYDGLKAKLDYLMKSLDETDPERIDVEVKLDKTVEDLNALRIERDQIVEKVGLMESEIHLLEEEVRDISKDKESAANNNFTDAGMQTKEISKLRSEKAGYQVEVDKHVRYIGRFLFKNRKNKEVKACIKTRKELLSQINVLRTSVILNHKLVDSSVDLQSLG